MSFSDGKTHIHKDGTGFKTMNWNALSQIKMKQKTEKELSKYREIGEEMRVADKSDIQKKPYLRYGLGVNGFFMLLQDVIRVYVFLSIIGIIQILIFRNSNEHHG